MSGNEQHLLIINWPNLNMLGIREPAIYGRETYADLVARIERACALHGFACTCFQSNHEGAIVDEIQRALGSFDGIIRKSLVKIAHPKQQDGIGIFFFDLIVLLH